jgi:hypothetical protein
MASSSEARRGERGAVVIQVAVCLLILLAFTSFVLDYGFMWTGRAQAQTSADAGALSGAISLAWDSTVDYNTARTAAIQAAQVNAVWSQAPDVQPTDVLGPWTPYPCPPGSPGIPDTCVKVTAYRNQARSNPLPMFFGQLVGMSNQGVLATATAQVLSGNSTECLRPWAVVDRWNEFGAEGPAPLPTSTYDKYSDGRGNNPPQENDEYVPPHMDGATGYTLPADEGRQFAIKIGGGDPNVSSGWFQTIDLPRRDTTQLGNNTVQNNILSCNGMPAAFADPAVPCPTSIANDWNEKVYWAARGCFTAQTGATVGSTANSIEALIARDPGAAWDGTGITGSNFDPPNTSPRVVPIGVMNIDLYLQQNPNGQGGVIRMENIYGFFIEGMGDVDRNTGLIQFPARNGSAVVGRIVSLPSMGTGRSNLPTSASFLRTVVLIR